MNTHTTLSTQTKKKNGGFTLIEVIAVLVLLGILAAIALPRYIDMADTARDRAIDAGIAELNGREALTWGNFVIGGNYADDAGLFAALDTVLGNDYNWSVAPAVGGGTLDFETTATALNRAASTATQPGQWSR